jgi:hypothetical protein
MGKIMAALRAQLGLPPEEGTSLSFYRKDVSDTCTTAVSLQISAHALYIDNIVSLSPSLSAAQQAQRPPGGVDEQADPGRA